MKQSKISIDEETHKLLKVHCAQHGLLMSQFVVEIIRERIDNDIVHQGNRFKKEALQEKKL